MKINRSVEIAVAKANPTELTQRRWYLTLTSHRRGSPGLVRAESRNRVGSFPCWDARRINWSPAEYAELGYNRDGHGQRLPQLLPKY